MQLCISAVQYFCDLTHCKEDEVTNCKCLFNIYVADVLGLTMDVKFEIRIKTTRGNFIRDTFAYNDVAISLV